MYLFYTEFNTFQGLNIAKKSSILYVAGVPQPTSAIVFPPKILFVPLKQRVKMFEKSNFTINRSRTPVNNEDVTISNNSLRLKAVYYGIVTKSSILNVGRGPRSAFDYNGILKSS